MHNLIKAEFYKLAKSPAYKWLLVTCLIFVFIFNRKQISDGMIYTGSEWLCMMLTRPNYIIWFSVFAAFYVAGEFTNRTIISSLLCGFSRGKIFWAKSAAFFVGILLIMLTYALTGTAFWSAQYGFGVKFSSSILAIIGKVLIYCLHSLFVFGSSYLLCAVFTRNMVATIGFSLGITQILGIVGGNIEFMQNPVIRKILGFIYQGTVYWQMSWNNGANPIWQLAELTGENMVWQVGELSKSQPDIYIPIWLSVLTSLVVSAIMLAMAANVFKRQDLK